MSSVDGTALGRCVGDVDRFRREHWARRVLLRRQVGDRGFDDLLSLGDVDRLLATTLLRRPAFRLVRDGAPLDPASYCKRIRLGSQVLDDVADVGRVHRQFAAGATIVLQGLQRQWLPLTRFCRDLELELGHPVQANAYVTPAGGQGLGLHADTHDVLLLQVQGSKHWAVWEPDAATTDPAALDTELHPGDTLYLPEGARHSARTMATASVHITVGILATTWADLMRSVFDRAVDRLDLDRPLPLGYVADAGFPEELAARLAELRADLGEVDAGEAWRTARSRFVAGRTPSLTGGLAAVIAPPAVEDDTELVRRRGAMADLVPGPGPDQVSLVLGDRTLRMPAALEPALRLVLDAGRLTPADLGGLLEPASRLVLLRRLVKEGLLEVGPGAE